MKDKIVYETNTRVTGGQEATVNINFEELIAKQGTEAAEAVKKQEEEKKSFEAMKTHFDTGIAALDQARQVRNDLQRTPADQRVPWQAELGEWAGTAVSASRCWAQLGPSVSRPFAQECPGIGPWRPSQVNAIVKPVRGGRLSIAVGQVPLTIHFPENELRHKAEERYAAFRVSEDGLPIFLEPETKPIPGPRGFTYRLHNTSTLCLNFAAYFSGVQHESRLDSLIRVLLTVLLLPRRGFLLHAATVVRDERAYVFTGPPGAGKSTVAALSPLGSVLTDEISLLRFHGGAWRAHGTPFWGEFRAEGSNVHFPLAGIYALTQSDENRVERLRAKESLRALLPNILFFCSRKGETDQLLEIVSEAVSQIPFYRLFFVRQPSFWEAIV